MELTVSDRITILGVLPKESNIFNMRIIADLTKELGFTEDELKQLNFRQEGQQIMWNTGVASKEVNIGTAAKKVVADAFKKASDAEKLTVAMLPLYDKFVEGGG